MAACPAGHESSTTDYCDTCGARMTAPTTAPPAPAPEPAAHCARCGEPRGGRFCEACGHDADLPVPDTAPAAQPVPAAGWTAVVRADRAWFEEVRRRDGPDAATLEFPPYAPERRFTLSGPQMAIGRRSRSRGIDPEIDLSGPPLDPGVSTLHALLLPGADGGWTIVDLQSTNGTTVGDDAAPIPPNTPVALPDGTVVKIGAWTTLSVHAP
jgi:FHA domain